MLLRSIGESFLDRALFKRSLVHMPLRKVGVKTVAFVSFPAGNGKEYLSSSVAFMRISSSNSCGSACSFASSECLKLHEQGGSSN